MKLEVSFFCALLSRPSDSQTLNYRDKDMDQLFSIWESENEEESGDVPEGVDGGLAEMVSTGFEGELGIHFHTKSQANSVLPKLNYHVPLKILW